MSIALERKYPSTYPSDAVAILDAMSFSEGDDVKVIGSMSLRSQLYAGDYDADEDVKRFGDSKKVLKELSAEFAQIMGRLKKIPKAVIGDIKAGSIEEYRVLPTAWKDFHTMASLKVVECLPIPTAEKTVLTKKIASIRTEMDFILLKHELKYHTVRWTPAEVETGHKKVQDGSTMTLEQAFQCPAPVKVDVVGWVSNNHYTEFSMVYKLYCNGKLLNDARVDVEAELKEAVKYYEYEGNPFKAMKRRFALARLRNETAEMERISKTLNSDLGKIYSILSDVGTLIYLLEEGHSINKDIEYEVNSFKERLSHIYTVKGFLSKEESILKDLDALLDKPTLGRLEVLEGLLMGLLKKHTPLKGGLIPIDTLYPSVKTNPDFKIEPYSIDNVFVDKNTGKVTHDPTKVTTYVRDTSKQPSLATDAIKTKMLKDLDFFSDLAHYYHNRDHTKALAYQEMSESIYNFLGKQMEGKADPPISDHRHNAGKMGWSASSILNLRHTPAPPAGTGQPYTDINDINNLVQKLHAYVKTNGRDKVKSVPPTPNGMRATGRQQPWGDAQLLVPNIEAGALKPGSAVWKEYFNMLIHYPNMTSYPV